MERISASEQFQQWSSYRCRLQMAHRRQRQRFAVITLSVLALLLAALTGLLVYRLILLQTQLDQLRLENQRLQAAAEQSGQLAEDNAALTQRLAEAEQEARLARQALDDRLAAEAEARRNAASPYSTLYPELYAAPAALESIAAENTVYLTFDDGPSARTAEVLDILAQYDIKATFFVTGQTSELAQEMMRRIVAEGHTIAIHTYSHQYETVYASVPAFLEDFNRIYTWVHQVTGVYPQIFRFPGGSVNDYNREIYQELVAEMDRRGFVHYDWNAANGDALGINYTVAQLTRNALSKVGTSRLIVLMHDSAAKTGTVACLPAVIEGYRDAGYSFAPLTPEVEAVTFD